MFAGKSFLFTGSETAGLKAEREREREEKKNPRSKWQYNKQKIDVPANGERQRDIILYYRKRR